MNIKILANYERLDNGHFLTFTFDEKYKNQEPSCKCEKCGVERYRKNAYLIEVDGKVMYIGNNCLNTMLGNTELDKYSASIYRGNERDFFFSSGGGYKHILRDALITMLSKLPIEVKELKLEAFLKISATDEEIEANKELISNIVKYYEENIFTNEFMNNLSNLMKDEYIDLTYFNIVKYAYSSYIKHLNYNKINSETTPLQDNEAFTIKSIFLKDHKFTHIAYHVEAESYIYRIITTTGKLLDLSTSKELTDLDNYINKTYTATVKKNKYSNLNEAQTYNSINGIVTKINRLKEIKC